MDKRVSNTEQQWAQIGYQGTYTAKLRAHAKIHDDILQVLSEVVK